MRRKMCPFFRAREHCTAFSIQPQDIRRAFKCAKHEGDPAIFERMRGGFVAAADEIQVGYLLVGQNPKSIEALGRNIDAPVGVEWGGADKKQMLFLDKCPMCRQNGFVKFSHVAVLDFGLLDLGFLDFRLLNSGP